MVAKAKVIAVYSLKGGVGKTTMAVNLAAELALTAARDTLLWDLDPQSAASFILGRPDDAKPKAQAVFERDLAPQKLIRPTPIDDLHLLPADTSLRGLDGLFSALGKKRRLSKLIEAVSNGYGRIVLDCPPGLTETSEQVVRAADLIVVPLIPSLLSRRALDDVVAYLKQQHKGHAPILPVYSMVDRRRLLHKAALEAEPDWPKIPMASVIEKMAEYRAPLAHYARRDPANATFSELALAIDRKLAQR
jgi:chromosome partitioning protein